MSCDTVSRDTAAELWLAIWRMKEDWRQLFSFVD